MNARILLVDDHPMLRSGLCQELGKKAGLEIVGQAASGPEAVKLAGELAPDLVIMDVHLGDSSGIAATEHILNQLSAVKVIVFSADSSQVQVDDALRAGACGYVLKSGAVDELLHAIEWVLQGRLYVSPELSAGILASHRANLTQPQTQIAHAVSEKEKQLLRLLAAGKRSKEIADHLDLSVSTVETYRMRLRKKLDCQSTADLVRYAIANKIAEL